MRTKYFKLYTGYAESRDVYAVLHGLAQKWESLQLSQVRIFFAGFVHVYLAITASKWFQLADSNDSNYTGDAEDELRSKRKFVVSALRQKPTPEKRWQGQWDIFATPESFVAWIEKKTAK